MYILLVNVLQYGNAHRHHKRTENKSGGVLSKYKNKTEEGGKKNFIDNASELSNDKNAHIEVFYFDTDHDFEQAHTEQARSKIPKGARVLKTRQDVPNEANEDGNGEPANEDNQGNF